MEVVLLAREAGKRAGVDGEEGGGGAGLTHGERALVDESMDEMMGLAAAAPVGTGGTLH